MTYGFCPEDWPLFHSEIEKRRIEVGDIERVEMRPDSIHSSVAITVILRSGRVESWTQDQVEPVRHSHTEDNASGAGGTGSRMIGPVRDSPGGFLASGA